MDNGLELERWVRFWRGIWEVEMEWRFWAEEEREKMRKLGKESYGTLDDLDEGFWELRKRIGWVWSIFLIQEVRYWLFWTFWRFGWELLDSIFWRKTNPIWITRYYFKIFYGNREDMMVLYDLYKRKCFILINYVIKYE